MFTRVTLIILILFSTKSLAQQVSHPVWPNEVSAEEKAYIEENELLENWDPRVMSRGIETPPPYTELRTAAEWEEIEVLTIAWEGFNCILKQIVAASISECRVVVFTENPNSTSNYLTSSSCGGTVDLSNVDIVQANLNTIWIRDYGANTVYGSWNDDRILVDWMYNRPRPDDDVIPDVLGSQLGLEVYSTTAEPYDLMNTGGNWMSDGFGTAFESELVIDENQGGSTWWTDYPNHTDEEIEAIFEDFLGVHTFIKMPTLPYDGIHHIDMHMKLLDESTLMVSEYPDGIADGPQINANIDYVLSNYTTKWGTPFNVIRIPSPPQLGGGYPNTGGWYETYSNAVFVNEKILLPTYYEQYDTTAIRIWEEAMPGYEIVGIDCDGSEPIISLSGAIHCITHSVSVEDPLIISHLPLQDTENTTDPYSVEAYLSHRSGIATATLSYSDSPTGPWTEVIMIDSGDGENWTADIPAAPENTNIYYFISGISNSGKIGDRPMPAPEGWWTFHIGEIIINGIGSFDLNQIGAFASAYPNPASAITCVPVTLRHEAEVKILLRDALGREIETLHDGTLPSGETKLFFQASSLPAGAYIVTLEFKNGRVASTRVMVQ
ncbi:MAG TPA: T9SS type A sorting domain-containing protein [Flavobacteriales bacterium]|jgi:agmatine/peptidylarginine deiminase|nr:T9SS type A sorting domain-containing protein [Flavobacteriales bacterium]HIO58931.1 T9SS type A sorting domain-containing protein [Flavobacteriales bacterium]